MNSRERAKDLVDGWITDCYGWHYGNYADITATKCELDRLKDAISKALAAPALEWTRERPTKQGHYWFSDDVNGEATMLYVCADGTVFFTAATSLAPQDFLHNGTWAGPLEVPT